MSKIQLLLVLLFSFSSFLALADEEFVAPADTVVEFLPGSGPTGGQSELYFPANILGWPSPNAQKNVPESSQEEICSIGLGGSITLSWSGKRLVDRDGVDFTVYENAFEYFNGIYTEPAVVSVSQDGIEWLTFPFNDQTLEGLAGTQPTIGDADVSIPGAAGGDGFDIADLGLEYIRYIRLTDTTNLILKDKEHPNYDVTLNGFDLDAVVGYSVVSDGTSVVISDNNSRCIDCKYPTINVAGEVTGTATINEVKSLGCHYKSLNVGDRIFLLVR